MFLVNSPRVSCVIPDAVGERESMTLCNGKPSGLSLKSKMDPRSAARSEMTTTPWRGPLLAALALLVTGPAQAQSPDPASPDCRREVFFTDGSLVASQRRLQDNASAKPAELCAIWRKHQEVLNKAAVSYQRCTSGNERASKLAPVQTSQREFSEAVRTRCKGL